jgi:hypothetical protein
MPGQPLRVELRRAPERLPLGADARGIQVCVAVPLAFLVAALLDLAIAMVGGTAGNS